MASDDLGDKPARSQKCNEQGGQLTAYQVRCLHKRICDLHEVLRIALMGVGTVLPVERGFAPICAALQAAEAAVDCAEQLALQRLHLT